MDRFRLCASARRVVVKVGSSTLTHTNGSLNFQRMDQLARQLTDLRNSGRDVVLVSSGAVSTGLGRLGFTQRPKTMPEKQAAAAVGQGLLMQAYTKIFGEYNQVVAQVLLTREDLDYRLRYLNARNTLNTLLSYGAIPIVNENDTVATDELRNLHFGDNDRLSALVALAIDADLLILLSDIDGLYDQDPRKHQDARRLTVVEEITPEIAAGAGGAGTAMGTGGMATKIEAARMATLSGTGMVLANGATPGVIGEIFEGKPVGTLFLPREEALLQRQRWMAFAGYPTGAINIDEGAVSAILERGKSLLPSGVTQVNGDFEPGDLIKVLDPDGKEIARGLTNYSHTEVCRVMGHRSSEIEELLGHKNFDEIIHRNNLVCLI